MDLKEEGNKILEDEGLLDIVSEFGKPQIVGSYDFELLVHPDIDISIPVEKFDIDKYFSVCSKIVKKIKPIRIKYIDQSVAKLPFDFEQGYYLGIHIPRNGLVWKIDNWLFTPEEFRRRIEAHNRIKESINEENKKILLDIKKEICYSPSYVSIDLYNAILFDNVRSLSEFYNWYREKKSKEFVKELKNSK